ncbi:MAG: DegT/DnrJ/EryC1/StrS family aminotransferase [bacterium]
MADIDIPISEPVIDEDDAEAVYEVVQSGWVTQGEEVEKFEEKFSDYVGVDHSIAVFNGTVALHVLLEALDIGEGDEVIVPTLSYVASANAVEYTGAKPVLCESDPDTYNVRPDLVEPHITDDTAAIMTVDMNGTPVDFEAFSRLAQSYDIEFISDSAESLGAEYKDNKVGGQAKAHTFSMYPNKSITTAEGGMVTTNDDKLANRLRTLRHQGQDGRYNHVEVGFNYRMTEMQAALGRSQLDKIDSTLERKDSTAQRYNEELSDIAGLGVPVIPEYVTAHSWYMYTISVEDPYDRDALVEYLNQEGIDTRLSFPPIHGQKAYREEYGYKPSDYPLSQEAWESLLNLPISPRLSEKEQDRVLSALRDFVESNA